MDDIQLAQVTTAEDAVVERLRRKGLLPPDPAAERQHLEHALATAFVSMQGTRDAAERQKHWFECLRLASEIQKLNNHKENPNV